MNDGPGSAICEIRDEQARPTRLRPARVVALALLGLAGVAGPTAAQTPDCNRLQAAIRASENDNGQRDPRAFDRAAQQQRREIERTRRYAAQLNCEGGGFGLFGGDKPPECRDIEDRLGRMQDNLDRMQAQTGDEGQDDGAARQSALIARYNAACLGGGNPANLAQDGTAGFLANEGQNPADADIQPPDDLSTVPLNGDIMEGGSDGDHVVGRSICVRTCDGGYFPLAPRATASQLDGLEKLCQASCPNTEAKLYTMHEGDLGSATAVDGSTYTMLPAAFKFEKSFSATCTCKPPNRSWADALAGAEQLLDKGDRRDVTVTAALSDQMAKPLATPVPGKGKTGRSKGGAPPPAVVSDGKVLADAQRAAKAPTASHDSSGIGGPAKPDRVVGASDGLRITTEGPDGVTKRIRLIVP